jgi:hypothetical protein
VRLARHGLEVRVPPGWEGKVFRLPGTGATLHAANFALPAHDGSFGATAVSEMADDGVFVAVVEFSARLAGRGLFAHQGFAGLRAREASPRSMQRLVPGRAGVQRFFTAGGRAFCLYAVVGSRPSREVLIGRANDLLRSVRVTPRSPSGSAVPLEG